MERLCSFRVNIFRIFLVLCWTCAVEQTNAEQLAAKLTGNLTIGALFPVHHKPDTLGGGFTRKCGLIREQYGIHRVEIFLKTLDEINQSHDILPNVTLGCDVRDSCWYPPVALEQSIDFIKNSIASDERSSTAGTSSKCPF